MEKSQLRNFIQEKLKKTLNEDRIESDSQVVMWDDEEHEVVRRVPDEEYGERVYIRRKAPSAMLGKLDDFWVPAGELNEANKEISEEEIRPLHTVRTDWEYEVFEELNELDRDKYNALTRALAVWEKAKARQNSPSNTAIEIVRNWYL